MNKIIVNNSEMVFLENDQKIEVTFSNKVSIFDIPKIHISVLENTNLEIEYIGNDDKLEVEIVVPEQICFHVFEIRKENKLKVQYKYNLEKNSYLNMSKFYLCDEVKELDIVYLNGENSKIDYTLKTIATENQKYDMVVYHNQANTISNIIQHGITDKNGSIIMNVTGNVYDGVKNCELDQKNRIIAFNQKKSIIQPILLIDDKDVVANHSAYIGKFSDEELFYLMSRGISFKDATMLLAKGFLLEGISENEKVLKLIDEYWGVINYE